MFRELNAAEVIKLRRNAKNWLIYMYISLIIGLLNYYVDMWPVKFVHILNVMIVSSIIYYHIKHRILTKELERRAIEGEKFTV